VTAKQHGGTAPAESAVRHDSARRAGRRGLATAVLACLAGAAIALVAVTRTWTTTIERQAAPLPNKVIAHTGVSLLGWVSALALVGLAGAGALLATKGAWRRGIGVVVALVGLGVVAGGMDGLNIAAGAWPVLVGIGGLAIAWAGLSALRSSATWPAMGTRYERPATGTAGPEATGEPVSAAQTTAADRTDADRTDADRTDADRTDAGAVSARPRRTAASMWDDLDRGVDPTDRDE
jgi:hypothetical protein